MLQLLTEAAQSDPKNYQIHEAYLTCISRMVKHLDDERDNDDTFASSLSVADDTTHSAFSMLLDLIALFSATLLPADSPPTTIESYARSALGDLIGRSASLVPLQAK